MKTVSAVVKVLAALATVAGAIYIIATYGEQIVAWAKKIWANMPTPCCCKDEEAEAVAEEAPAAEEAAAEEPAAVEVPVEESVAQEIPVEEPVADEADFAE